MRQLPFFLLLLVLFLGSCAVISRSLQPTIDTATQTWVAAETRTDPIDDLVRFREAERRGRSASLLLPFFFLATIALLALALLTPLSHQLKELRRLRHRQPRQRPASPPPGWIEPPPERPYPAIRPPTALPPPQASEWLENE